jgi:hypothetical protein
MSKFIKLAVIVAIGAVAVAAKQATLPAENHAGFALSAGPSTSISPMEITHGVGLLVETPVDNFM